MDSCIFPEFGMECQPNLVVIFDGDDMVIDRGEDIDGGGGFVDGGGADGGPG